MRLVLFDVDGTLVDSQNIIVAALTAAYAAHGLAAPSRAQALSIVGLSLPEAFSALLGPHAPLDSLAHAYRDAFFALRASAAHDEPFFPGAEAAVARLGDRTDVLIGLATGKSRRGVAHLCARAGWETVFATVQTADEHPSKPAPDMILAALAETGARADLAFMIGDTTYDMAMARAAGVRPIGVAWGYHDAAALREAGAEQVIAGFDALDALIGERI